MTKKYEINMCEGKIFPKIILFALPLMLTSTLQLLYNAADVIVVGKFAGSTALAAVSSTGSLISLIVNLFIGLSVGANVAVARFFGAKDDEGVSQTVHTSMLISLIGGIILGIIGYFGAYTFLSWMACPGDVIGQATVYMKIYFIGLPASMVYNFGSSILRAVGDTRRPLIILSVSGIINVVLNLVLVIVFHLGVAGVAIATSFSQLVSAFLVVFCMMSEKGSAVCFFPARMRIYSDKLTLILSIGIPAGVQSSVYAISNVLIQSSINSFGSAAIAGVGAAGNLESFISLAMNAFHHTALTFAGQNLGARKPERVRFSLYECLALVTGVGLALGMTLYLFGPQFLSIYDSNPEVIAFGMVRIAIMVPTQFIGGISDVLCGEMRGLGYSLSPTVICLIGACGFRIFWIYTIFRTYHTLQCLLISYPISWGLTAAAFAVFFVVSGRKLLKKISPDGGM